MKCMITKGVGTDGCQGSISLSVLDLLCPFFFFLAPVIRVWPLNLAGKLWARANPLSLLCGTSSPTVNILQSVWDNARFS